MLLREICTPDVVCCTAETTAAAAARLMRERHVGDVVIVEEAEGDQTPIGVITDRDLCLRVVAPGKYPAHTLASECMTPHPTCCHAEDNAETALQLMRDKQVRRLPVVNEQMELQGMISISDFIRCNLVERATLNSTLKEICQRSSPTARQGGTIHRAAA